MKCFIKGQNMCFHGTKRHVSQCKCYKGGGNNLQPHTKGASTDLCKDGELLTNEVKLALNFFIFNFSYAYMKITEEGRERVGRRKEG